MSGLPRESRCEVIDGDLVPGCWGAVHNGACGCYCVPTPRGIPAMRKREIEEDRRREAERKAAELRRRQEEARRAEEVEALAAKWKAEGGAPRLVRSA